MYLCFYKFEIQGSRQSTDYNTPITPPHPPKRPRTMSTPRTPLRRSQSLGLSENNQSSNFMEDNRQSSSAGGELNNRRKERIEVTVFPLFKRARWSWSFIGLSLTFCKRRALYKNTGKCLNLNIYIYVDFFFTK